MMITEKQLSKILKMDVEIEEADDTTTATPSVASSTTSGPSYDKSAYGISSTTTTDPGSSPGADDYPAYPETVKWESGVTRGPANQIAVTKWSDTVGSSLTRGKANPLK